MMRIALYFLLAAALFFAFFYLYPANVFEAEISNGITSVTTDVSLQALFFRKDLPEGIIAANVTSLSLTAKGWFLLVICLIGLPLMIAYRVGKRPV